MNPALVAGAATSKSGGYAARQLEQCGRANRHAVASGTQAQSLLAGRTQTKVLDSGADQSSQSRLDRTVAGVDRVVDTVGYSCKVTTMRIILLVCALLTGAVQANEQTLNALRAEFAQTGALSAASAEKLRELADSGNTPAMLVLANMADAGIGVNANQKWAFDWTLRAARNADPLAQYLLGERYIQRLGTPGDKTPDQLDERALFWMNKAAEQFEPAAMFALGQMLRTGQWRERSIAGVQVDAAAGLQMVELSAVQITVRRFWPCTVIITKKTPAASIQTSSAHSAICSAVPKWVIRSVRSNSPRAC